MYKIYKRLLFTLIYNSSLFLLLIIGIQNSSEKSKLKLLNKETINLPISFIIGTSFIAGSIFGNLLSYNLTKKKLEI